jgi:cellulose synthase operon protein C
VRCLRPVAFAVVLASSTAQALVWPNAVERVERALESDEVVSRRRAAADLSKLPAGAARRLVVRALGDEDAEVRLLAVGAAGDLRLENLGQVVSAWLSEPDARLRRAAAWALRLEPTAEASAALARALSDADVSVRLAAAEALGEAGDAEAMLPLLGRLDDPHPDVRVAAVRALRRSGDGRAVVPLVGKAQDSVIEVRREVARALGRLGDARAVGALVLQLDDREEDVRLASLEALGRLRSPEAVPAIDALLERERRGRVRRAAFAALGQIAGPAAVEALFAWLAREEPAAVEPVQEALAALGPSARERLEACVEKEARPSVADGCALALGASGVPGAAARVGAALRRGVVHPAAGLRALEASGDATGVPAVLEYLADGDPAIRAAAVVAAATLLDPAKPDGRAVQPILQALDAASSRHPRERIGLIALLGRTGSPRAAPALTRILDGTDDPVTRRAAARALGWTPSAASARALLTALTDPEPEVRFEAAVALGRSGAGTVASPLLRRYERAPRQDRGAIATALAGVVGRAGSEGIARRIAELAASRRGEEREALIEVLGAVPGRAGSEPLVAWLGRVDAPTRAKIAEALAGHPEASGALLRLAGDPDGAVRANAVWSLGATGLVEHAEPLTAALSDADVTVAGNAVAALGRLAGRATRLREPICTAYAHPHPYVRANALVAVLATGQRCDPAVERRLLGRDRSEVVRAAAAFLLRRLPPDKAERRDEEALDQCRDEDPSGRVAEECAAPVVPLTALREGVTVYVVPEGRDRPVGGVPFALRRPDGLMRLGVTDRRGAVREVDTPRGTIRLEIAAPLASR